jgi:hypothetical protein
MLLKNRSPQIETAPKQRTKGFEHLDDKALSVLRWLLASRVEFVLVGAVAQAVRGEADASGPVAIVPAPYGRNLDRLVGALHSAHARLRLAGESRPEHEVKLTAEKLVRANRWELRCGEYEIDVEGRPRGVPRYQELLYEANRFELAPEISVEVASPEDAEHYEHVRRTGFPPEIRISRSASPRAELH